MNKTTKALLVACFILAGLVAFTTGMLVGMRETTGLIQNNNTTNITKENVSEYNANSGVETSGNTGQDSLYANSYDEELYQRYLNSVEEGIWEGSYEEFKEYIKWVEERGHD